MSYDAFICYRHSDGRKVARWLRRRLVAYRLPNALQEDKTRRLSIYLDEIYDQPTEDFWKNTIEPALASSRHLIVVATPDATKTGESGEESWMQREIKSFLSVKGSDCIVVALALGEIDGSVPEIVRASAPNINVVDIRQADSLVSRIFSGAALTDKVRTFAAKLFDVSEDLMPVLREEDRRRRQRVYGAVSFVALSVVASFGYLLALNEREASKRQVAEAVASERTLVANAGRVLVRAEQVLERDATSAIAVALTSTEQVVLPSIRPLIERAAKKLPAVQVIQVEERKINRYEVLPGAFYGLRNLFFSSDGENIVAHHIVGFSNKETKDEEGKFAGLQLNRGKPGPVSIWNVETGQNTATLGTNSRPIIKIQRPAQNQSILMVLYSDGVLARFAVRAGGIVEEINQIETKFVDFFCDKHGKTIFGWDRDGNFYQLDKFVGDSKIDTFENGILFAGLKKSEIFISVIDKKYNLHIINRSMKGLKWSKAIHQHVSSRELDFSWKGKSVRSVFFDTIPALLVATEGDFDVNLQVFALDTGARIFEVSREYGTWAVDSQGGKLAVLTGGELEQWEIAGKDANSLSVTQSSKWKVPGDIHVGRGQALTYGPHGEYLVSASAPTLTLVGSAPGTVMLWYANPYTDSRAGDVHRGTRVGSRDVATFNIAFDSHGRRLAMFSREGLVRIYDVLPEQAVTIQSKADDFFSDYRHLSLETRALLDRDLFDLNSFVDAAEKIYKVRLTEGELVKLRMALASGESLKEIPKLEDPLSTSIALQLHNDRDEKPNLALESVISQLEELESYNPIDANKILFKLIDDVIAGRIQSDSEIIRRYIRAVEADVLLLTGLQIEPLMRRLGALQARRRSEAWIGLALSGDNSSLERLNKIVKLEANEHVQRHGRWAIEFLRTYGENFSLSNARAFRDAWPRREAIVTYPNRKKELARLQNVVGLPWTQDAWRIILDTAKSEKGTKTFPLVAQASRIVDQTPLGRSSQSLTDLNYSAYLKQSGRLAEALAIIEMLLDRGNKKELLGRPENAYGNVLSLMGRYEESIYYFKLSIENGRTDGWPERNMALALEELGRIGDSRKYYEKSIHRVEKALQLASQKLKEEELQRFITGTKAEVAGFYNAYAWHLASSSNLSVELRNKSLLLAQKAAKLTEYMQPNFLDTLAHAHAQIGEFQKALEIEKRALELVPESDKELRDQLRSAIKLWENNSK